MSKTPILLLAGMVTCTGENKKSTFPSRNDAAETGAVDAASGADGALAHLDADGSGAGADSQSQDAVATAALMAGTAREDVTPPWPVLPEVDYGGGKKLSGQYSPLEATALAVSDHRSTAVFVVMDVADICIEVSRLVYEKVKPLGLAPEQLILNSTHTHSAPALCPTDVAAPNVLDERYVSFFVEKVASAIKRATEAMRPAVLGTAEAPCGVCINRDGLPNTLYSIIPDPNGPIDRRVRLITVKDPADGKLRAVVSLFGCHPSDVEQWVSFGADFFGFARADLAKDFPGVTFLTAQGMGGDVRLNHVDPTDHTRFIGTYLTDLGPNKEFGRQLAESIREGLRQNAQPVRGPLRAAATEVLLPLGEPESREVVEQAVAGVDPISKRKNGDIYTIRWGRYLLSQFWEKGIPVPRLMPRPYAMRVIQFGADLTVAGIDGETYTCVGRQIEEALSPPGTARRTYVFGYTNDVNAYVPCRENFARGDGGRGINVFWWWMQESKFDPSVDEVIVDATIRLAKPLLQN